MKRLGILMAAGALAFLGSNEARALTFLELVTGDEGLLPDARSLAMGRTRVAEMTGAFTAESNPALLGRVDRTTITTGGSVSKIKESREIPAFDSFDGFLVESVYVLNDEYYLQGGVGGVTKLRSDAFPGGVGIGVSFAPVRDFQYDYVEEVRNNDAFTRPRDALIAVNEIVGSGALNAWTLGVGVNPWPWLSVGGSFQILRGGHDLLVQTRFLEEDEVDFDRLAVETLSGTRGVLGIAAHPTHRVDVAATWTTETTVDGDATLRSRMESGDTPGSSLTDGLYEGSYPHEVVVGLAYRPRAKLRTSIHLEAGWTEWSKFESTLDADQEFDDVWDFRVGIEHEFYNGLPIRFGFVHLPSPRDDQITTNIYTFGGGLPAGPFRVDLAFEVANRAYRFEDLFDDSMFGGTDRTQKDRVEESTLSGLATFTYDLGLLGG